MRHVKRLIHELKKRGDEAVVHKLRGKPSNRRIEDDIEREAVKILSAPLYQGFGPTLAADYLGSKHGIEASKETVRKWMIPGVDKDRTEMPPTQIGRALRELGIGWIAAIG